MGSVSYNLAARQLHGFIPPDGLVKMGMLHKQVIYTSSSLVIALQGCDRERPGLASRLSQHSYLSMAEESF